MKAHSPARCCSVTFSAVLYWIASDSHLIAQARTSLLIHWWLITGVWRAEPTLSGNFSRWLFSHPLITSKHDYFYLLSGPVNWEGDECVTVWGATDVHRAIWGAWERGFWLLSDGAELSARHLSPLCECCEAGSPANSCWGCSYRTQLLQGSDDFRRNFLCRVLLLMLLVLISHHTSYKSLKCNKLSILRNSWHDRKHLFTLTYSLALHEDSEQKKNSQPRGAGQARTTLSICCSISFLF